MKKTIPILAAAGLLALPSAAAGQSFGIAGRVGTMGAGVEAAVQLSDRIAARAGVGFMGLDFDATVEDIDVTFSLPDTWYNLGLDLYLTGALRIGAGFLFKPDDFLMSAAFDTDQEIGGQLFTPEEIGTLTGAVSVGERAPYLLLGFGKHTSSGIGLSLDIGAAFLEEAQVSLQSDGTAAPGIIGPELDREAQEMEDSIPTYVKIWPILSLGIRIGRG